MTFGRVVPISKVVAEILLGIALKVTGQISQILRTDYRYTRMNGSPVSVVVSWTFERTMTVLNALSSNRPVEAVTSAVRVRRALISQDLALSILLCNEEAAINRLALLCQLKSTNGNARFANYRLLLVLAKPS